LKRGVRSYVLRQGRTTPAQQRALDELSATYGIPYRQALLEPCSRPLVLEIGSGMGETTAAVAAERPDIDFIAVEVHGPGVGALLRRIEEQGLKNLRVIRHDAVEVLEHMIADGALAGIHLFFPDPWPKKRHHKRRLVQPAFAALAARKIASGGYLHAATDWPEYAAQIDAVLGAEPNFARAVEPKARPSTKFEQRGVRLGHEVRDLVFLRR
jgi:tRNA (guanine-N7-)-methyltransferase